MMDQKQFLKVAARLRVLQLFYHNCHNLAHGPTFVADHGLLGDFYSQAEDHYDAVVEYMIATLGGQAFDTSMLAEAVCEELEKFKAETMPMPEMFLTALQLEAEMYSDIESLEKGSPIGLRNLLGDVGQASDVRKYKLKQRLS